MRKKQKLIAVLLIFCMGISVFSETALAEGPENAKGQSEASRNMESASGETDLGTNDPKAEADDAQNQPKAGEAGDMAAGQVKADEAGDPAVNQPEAGDAGDSAGGPDALKTDDSAASRQEADKENGSNAEQTEPEKEEALSDADLDDPGRGRLSGEEIPAGFFGSGIQAQAASSSIKHNSRFSGYTIKQGIDVSKWNGTIDWKTVKNSGIEFAFIRTSYRGTKTGTLAKDPTAVTNMKNAAAAGVKIGAYIFSQAITKDEAVQEADYLLQTVKGYNITMPLVFDFEYYSGGRLSSSTKLTKRQRTDICLAFCDRIEKAGYTPLVYANKSMFTSDLYASEITDKYPAWLAHYTTSTDYAGAYDFWQYTSTGKVSGISGNVDMNFWYIKPGASVSFGTGSSSSSMPSEPAAPTAPAAPKLSGKASSYDKVNLSWKKISDASGYVLYRYDSSKKKYVKIKTITSAGTVSYTDTGRSMGKTYKYNIKAYKTEDGQTVYSIASSTVSVKTESTMTGKTNGTGIIVRSGPGASKKKLKKLGINTGVTITGMSGSWYRVSIKINGKKKTGYIKKTYVTIIRKPELTVSAASNSKIALKWNKISGASGYQIQRYNSSKKKYETIKTIKKGSTISYTNSGLKKNTTYKYRMRSYKTVKGKKIYSYYCTAKSAKTNK